jgi:hypothetical protein
VNLADDCIARDAADAASDLAGAQSFGPELLQELDSLVVPTHLIVFLARSAMEPLCAYSNPHRQGDQPTAAARQARNAKPLAGLEPVTNANRNERLNLLGDRD